MSRLDLYSEPYGAMGNIDARASRRALRSGGLDVYDLLLRETLQNSWDARTDDAGPIDFLVDGYELDEHQKFLFRTAVFATLPPGVAMNEDNLRAVSSALVFTDRGTHGLRGPTRADVAQTGEDDFVDFVRNIGRSADKALGGGTYGFGKGVLYEASLPSTVVVYSRTTTAGGTPVSRLMAIRLGSSYDVAGRRFTGRHWWGVRSPETGAEPLTGPEADQLAVALGMERLPAGRTGTAIMVVDPVVWGDEDGLDDILNRIRDAVLYWSWPHLIDGPAGEPTINFSISGPVGEVTVPDPRAHPVLADYAEAFTRSIGVLEDRLPRADWTWREQRISSPRGEHRELGALAFRRRPASSADPGPDTPARSETVALVRNPHFVVQYRDTPRDPVGRRLAGVFVADPAADELFARSEPVAHDDWLPANLGLKRYDRNPVKQALDKIATSIRDDAAAIPVGGGDVATAGLVALAADLGSILQGRVGGVDPRVAEVATGRRGTSGRAPTPRRGGRPVVTVTGPPLLRRLGSGRTALFPVVVHPTVGRVRLTGTARVVLDGASESVDDAPVGAPAPELVGWSSGPDEPAPSVSGNSLDLDGPTSQLTVLAWVAQPVDTAVSVTVEAELLGQTA